MRFLENWLAPDALWDVGSAAEVLRVDGNAAREAAVRSLSRSWEVADLLSDDEGDADVWLTFPDGRIRSTAVKAKAARNLYQAGMTIYLRSVPWLAGLKEDVAASVGVPTSYVEMSLFCNQPGAATPMHCDSVDTIALQVSGSKTWRVARNEDAPHPTTNMKPLERDIPRDVRQYAHGPMPREMPAGAEAHTLGPGALLYVPGGFWHSTYSSEASVSLHLHLWQYTWTDAILATLQSVLLRDVRWRQSARVLWGKKASGWGAGEALGVFRDVAERLTVGDLVMADGEASPLGMEDLVVRRARTGLEVGEDHLPGGVVEVTVVTDEHGESLSTVLEMSPASAHAVLAIARDRLPVSAKDLATRMPEFSAGEALQLLTELVRIGFVRRA